MTTYVTPPGYTVLTADDLGADTRPLTPAQARLWEQVRTDGYVCAGEGYSVITAQALVRHGLVVWFGKVIHTTTAGGRTQAHLDWKIVPMTDTEDEEPEAPADRWEARGIDTWREWREACGYDEED